MSEKVYAARPDIVTADLVVRYQMGETAAAIAVSLNCTPRTILLRLAAAGVERRTAARVKRRIARVCIVCGRDFERSPSQVAVYGGRYCGTECKYLATPKRGSREVRFWTKVDRYGPEPAHQPGLGPCWLWKRACNARGYGWFGFDSYSPMLAHRAAWILTNGAIPAALDVLHKCDVPPCVRPDHLFLGTAADNAQDRERKHRGRYGSRLKSK